MGMSYSIKITEKRKIKNGKIKCYCNGLRLIGTEEEVINSCKMIKLSRSTNVKLLNWATHQPQYANAAQKLDLPEWNTGIIKTLEEIAEETMKNMPKE